MWLCALADGMGGEQAGEVASRMAIEILAERWQAVVQGQQLRVPERQFLVDAIRDANERIYEASQGHSYQRGMGTTETLLLVRGWPAGMAYIGHVGDSRAYLVDTQRQINRITHDHSLVSVLMSIGQITAEEALTHDQRSVLYRCVGHEPTIEIDTFIRRLEPGDRLLLCSDGLNLYLSDDEIALVLRQEGSPTQICRRLVALANERGGEDNISAILLAVDEKTD